MSRHQGKPSLNSRDRKNPLVHWFKHEGEDRSVDLGTLMTLAKQLAQQRKRPDLAEDFAQWCVVSNLERIENGATRYAHLNKCPWLWSEFLEENFGAKSRTGPKWERATMTVSYDKPISDGESGRFLDLVQADQLSPEERLILKEELSNRSESEIEEALFNDRAARKANDRLVCDHLVKLCGSSGMTKYKPSHVATDLNLTVKEVRDTVQRLVKRGIIAKDRAIIHLKEVDPKELGRKRVA